MRAKFHNDSLPTIRDTMFYWNFTKTAKAAILVFLLKINKSLNYVASTSKVFSMGHSNQLTWILAANIPSPLVKIWNFATSLVNNTVTNINNNNR